MGSFNQVHFVSKEGSDGGDRADRKGEADEKTDREGGAAVWLSVSASDGTRGLFTRMAVSNWDKGLPITPPYAPPKKTTHPPPY